MKAREIRETQLVANLRADRSRFDWPGWSLAFLVCSFIGWVFETTAVWRDTGHFTTRGYLTILHPLGLYIPAVKDDPVIGHLPVVLGLPLIEMYGFGAVIILLTLHSQRTHPVRIFCIGLVMMTMFELVSSYVCTYVVHREFWNYSTDFLNFQGRICLRSSIAWGVLSMFTIEILDPLLDRIYAHEKGRKYFHALMIVLMTYAAFCAVLKYWVAPGLFA